MMDDLLCPKCDLIVSDDQNSIFCDVCKNWFHLRCTGLTRQRFEHFASDPSSQWFCKECIVRALPFQNND